MKVIQSLEPLKPWPYAARTKIGLPPDYFVFLFVFFYPQLSWKCFQRFVLLDNLTTDWVNFPHLVVVILVISGMVSVHSGFFGHPTCAVNMRLLHPVNDTMFRTWSPSGSVVPGHQRWVLCHYFFIHALSQIFCLLISKGSWLVGYSSCVLWRGCVSWRSEDGLRAAGGTR